MPSGETKASPDPAEPDSEEAKAAARAAAKVRRREQAQEVMAVLRARWPAAFPTPVPVPLATDIHQEIKQAFVSSEEHVSSSHLGGALYHWMTRTGYLAAVANGVRRVHLDGTDAGEPDEEARAHARGMLAERKIWMRPSAVTAPAPAPATEDAVGEHPRSSPEGSGEGVQPQA